MNPRLYCTISSSPPEKHFITLSLRNKLPSLPNGQTRIQCNYTTTLILPTLPTLNTMSSQDSIWPSQIVPEPVKQLILKFFSIIDIKSDTSGELLAEEVFSSTGQMKAGPQIFSGSTRKLSLTIFITFHSFAVRQYHTVSLSHN
jgi:hypothetical protein